jgi:hypothetical protein
MNRIAVLLLASATVACSHAPPAPQGEEAPVVGPPQVAWKDMTKEQRGRYMKARVLPRFKELMASFAPEHEGEVNCATCHGKSAKDHSFKMPNPDLKVLPATQEGWQHLNEAKGEWVKFMTEKVKPEIAALLGLEPFDFRNPKEGAFGCDNCHTMEQKPQASR